MKTFTTKQAADILGVSDSRVRQLIIAGKLKATRTGNRAWSISQEDLKTFIIRDGRG